jgi:lysozyme
MLNPPRPQRRCNDKGIALIKEFEGLRLTSYYCTGGKCTIGYGHTGRDVKPGMTITEEEAETLLRIDLASAEAAVSRMVRAKISHDQFSALVSLVFNAGETNIAKSTLIRKLNAQDFMGAWAEFPKWVHAGGRISQGLIRRRAAEQRLFKPKPGDAVY